MITQLFLIWRKSRKLFIFQNSKYIFLNYILKPVGLRIPAQMNQTQQHRSCPARNQ